MTAAPFMKRSCPDYQWRRRIRVYLREKRHVDLSTDEIWSIWTFRNNFAGDTKILEQKITHFSLSFFLALPSGIDILAFVRIILLTKTPLKGWNRWQVSHSAGSGSLEANVSSFFWCENGSILWDLACSTWKLFIWGLFSEYVLLLKVLAYGCAHCLVS